MNLKEKLRSNSNLKIGLALSGGGARGVAHIGVIKYLYENAIDIHSISGTSAGAVIGAAYAAGMPAEKILDMIEQTRIFSIKNYTFKKPGLFDPDHIRSDFEKWFPKDNFDALQKKLFINATNLYTGKQVVFCRGQLINPILASAAYPVVFSPVEIEGELYGDGGIINNFLVEPLIAHCDHIIGVYVTPIQKLAKGTLKNTLSIMERTYQLILSGHDIVNFDYCDTLIQPEQLKRFGTFDMKHFKELLTIGYEAAKITLEG